MAHKTFTLFNIIYIMRISIESTGGHFQPVSFASSPVFIGLSAILTVRNYGAVLACRSLL